MHADHALLYGLAVSIAAAHTLLGPDHYLPLIVMSKARRWSLKKTASITFACGLGHVLSSVLLGLAGIALGIAVSQLEFIESARGEIAAWFLIAFGFVYLIWGLRSALKNKGHSHAFGGSRLHSHEDGTVHVHSASDGHDNEHSLSPLLLFAIFVLGPCEPLIPLLMYPAAKGSAWAALWVSLIFSAVTIATMLGIVLAGSFGLGFVRFTWLERYGNALAGGAICTIGILIKVFGL